MTWDADDLDTRTSVATLTTTEIVRQIGDMREFLEDPSWSLDLKLSAEAYLPFLQQELELRGDPDAIARTMRD